MSWWAYVQSVTPGAPQAEIASAAGVTAPTVSRWSTGKQGVDPQAAARFARSCGRPVLEAFVAAGFLTEAEARVRPAGRPDYSQLSNDDLLALVASRMREDGELGGDTAATSTAGTSPAYDLTHRREHASGPVEQLPAAARTPGRRSAGERLADESAALGEESQAVDHEDPA